MENYTDLDLNDFGIQYIKRWLKDNNIKIKSNTPLSWVEKKYGNDIRDSLDIYSRSSLASIGRRAVEMGYVKPITMRPKTKFTKKFKTLLDRVAKITLPPNTKIIYTEDKPYEVTISLNVDAKKFLKNGTLDQWASIQNWPNRFKEFLRRYASLEPHGNPLHGEVRIMFQTPDLFDEEEYGKGTEFDKKIREYFKTNSKRLRRVTIEVYSDRIRIKPVYVGGYSGQPRYDERHKFQDEFNTYLRELGYNPEFISISY